LATNQKSNINVQIQKGAELGLTFKLNLKNDIKLQPIKHNIKRKWFAEKAFKILLMCILRNIKWMLYLATENDEKPTNPLTLYEHKMYYFRMKIRRCLLFWSVVSNFFFFHNLSFFLSFSTLQFNVSIMFYGIFFFNYCTF
jgi:predicted ATPase